MGAKARIIGGAILALFLLSTTAHAQSAAAYKKYRGKIVVSQTEIPANFSVADLKKLGTTALASGQGGTWEMFFVGFMSKAPGRTPINLVFYDVTEKGKREYVSAKEINIDAGSNILLSSVTLSEDDSLNKNHTYDVMLAVMQGGKETVFARTKLTLK